MNLRSIGILCAVFALALVASPAGAAQWQFNVGSIDGLQEVPPNASPGFGTATILFDDVSGAMTINGSYSGLLAATTLSHIHGYSAAGVNSGVIIPLTHSFNTSGTVSGAGIIPAGNIASVLNGLTYLNIHTSVFPGGEIRGQLVDPVRVPEPATAALGAIALIALAARRRRTSVAS